MSADPIGNIEGKRLVIFGAGYVGSAVAAKALELGHSVTALTRNLEAAERLAALGAEVVRADLSDHDWHSKISPADWVLNCVSSGGGGASGYQHSYVDGLRSIGVWLREKGAAETLVYTSSTSVYPQKSGVVDETSSTAEAAGNASILLEAEHLVFAACADSLCRGAVVLRLAGIYGPSRHHLLDQLRASDQPIAGRGDHLLNLIYRDDIVTAILATFSASLAGPNLFNVSDDTPTLKTEVVAWLAEKVGKSSPGFSAEPVPGRRANPPDRAVSNCKIKTQLGWRPQFPDFRAGYRQILGA